MLDCARGTALLLMLISHSLELFPGKVEGSDWTRINAFLLVTKAATPLFVFVFGMTMAFVYFDRILTREGVAVVKRRMWRRALFAFLSFEFLVLVIESAGKTPPIVIVERMLYLRPGNWAEVLNFYIVVLLIGPWLLQWWKGAPKVTRAVIVPGLYLVGTILARIPVPSYLFVLKNIIAGYAPSNASGTPLDTFPVLQLSSFYLVGLSLGNYLHRQQQMKQRGRLFWLAGMSVVFGLLLSYVTSGDPVHEYLRNMALDRYRFPPQVAYVLFGLSSVVAITLFWLWAAQIKNSTMLPIRIVELLGRHSLFTFNVQYVLIFTVCGLVLDQLRQQTLLWSVLDTLIIIGLCVLAVWLWEQWKGMRSRTPTRVVS